MQREITLAALPSTLQLCLQSADRCFGLIQTTPRCAFVPRKFHALEVGASYAPESVGALLQMGLLACNATFNNVVRVTDDGVELLNTGYSRREVTP